MAARGRNSGTRIRLLVAVPGFGGSGDVIAMASSEEADAWVDVGRAELAPGARLTDPDRGPIEPAPPAEDPAAESPVLIA